MRQGIEQVPDLARELGMKVLLGVWIGGDRSENAAELDIGIALTRSHPDTVRALVVGNEVLLRRELPEAELAALLQKAGRESAVPVTYADVWEFWSEHPALAKYVTFVTVHILPYWEDHPVAIDEAVPHVVRIVERMRVLFDGKDILIGETGWPSAGRMREGARPGRVEQARFFREFSLAAREHGLSYNFIEAFDQPWKRRLEGAMGGAWGVFDSHARPKFPATGPLGADPLAARLLPAAAIGAAGGIVLLAAAFAASRSRRARELPAPAASSASSASMASAASGRTTDTVSTAGGAIAVGAMIGVSTIVQALYLQTWMRDWSEWLAGIAIVLAGSGLALLAAWRLATAAAASIAGPIRWASDRRLHRIAGALAGFVLFGLAVMMTLLVFDSRYRGFPVALYALPTAAVLLFRLGGGLDLADARENRMLAATVLAGGLFVLWNEGLANTQATGFVVLAWVYALATAGADWARARRRPRVTAESSVATAAGSAE